MPRKTDSNNAADWLWIAGSDLPMICAAAGGEFSFAAARSKLAEVLEKVIKAELIRFGWHPGISEATAYRDWEYARAWLHEAINADAGR